MIQISLANAENLVEEHYTQFVNHVNNVSRVTDFDELNNWFTQNGSHNTLKEVITGKTDQLTQIKNAYTMARYPRIINHIKNIYKEYFMNGERHLGHGDYNGKKLYKKLNIKVCPYCNRSFINTIYGRAHFQFDHFYNSSDYPFLAMSFYNLIPSCNSCNFIKNTQPITVSPYDSSLNIDTLLNFFVEIDSLDSLFDEEKLEVKINNSPIINSNINVFGLRELYSNHNDIAFEIIWRYIFNPEEKINYLINTFGSNFNRNQLERIIYGNYISNDNIGKRPLAKLYKDIITQTQNYFTL